jgi:alpha-N-arabinofuranosidase
MKMKVNRAKKIILLQVVNFGSKAVNLNISVTGLETNIQIFGSIKTVLTSGWLRDENSFEQPDKV